MKDHAAMVEAPLGGGAEDRAIKRRCSSITVRQYAGECLVVNLLVGTLGRYRASSSISDGRRSGGGAARMLRASRVTAGRPGTEEVASDAMLGVSSDFNRRMASAACLACAGLAGSRSMARSASRASAFASTSRAESVAGIVRFRVGGRVATSSVYQTAYFPDNTRYS